MDVARVWDPLERSLWGIAILIALLSAVYFINKGDKRKIFNEKLIMFSLASLILGFAFSLIFTFFQVLQIPGELALFDSNTFIAVTPFQENAIYKIYGRLSYISLSIGFTFFLFAFDIIVKKTKYFFTITYLILLSIEIIFFANHTLVKAIFNFPIILGMSILVPLVFYLYTRWSRLEFKAISSFLSFGFLMFITSLNLAKSEHKQLGVYPLAVSPLLLIFGCFITILPTIVNPKFLSRALLYWMLYAIITVPFLVAIIILDILNGLKWYFVMEFFIAFVYIYTLFFFTIRNIRFEIIAQNQKREKEGSPQILGIFVRPEKVTEEEVIYHRERKICLVCKGKLLREIYLCPECDALYCTKCSEAISSLENACWSCLTPIDPSKPVKLKEKEEIIEPKISTKTQKNLKTKTKSSKKME